jgi:peroxin-7
MKIFDLRAPAYEQSTANTPSLNPQTAAALTVPASGTEILSVDWNKYRQFVLATGGVDRDIKVWDCRMIKLGLNAGPSVGGLCETRLPGHEYAVRKVQWNPHAADILASASYDMTCRV